MSIKYRKRIFLFPWVVLNISKSGVSVTLGPRCLSINIGKKGVYLNTTLRGTGLYDRKRIKRKSK